MTPTSAVRAKVRRKATERRLRGFTLLEVLLALSLIGLVAAVSLPALSNRIDQAFRDADLAFIVAQARDLPLRCAQLEPACRIGAGNWQQPLGDGQPALTLPLGWSLQGMPKPLHVGRGGICNDALVHLQAPGGGERWSLALRAPSCEAELRPGA